MPPPSFSAPPAAAANAPLLKPLSPRRGLREGPRSASSRVSLTMVWCCISTTRSSLAMCSRLCMRRNHESGCVKHEPARSKQVHAVPTP
eukprot:1158942-Pelagomonas_calceolata.AAC.10